MLKKLPKQLGYRMPAEWELHQGTWLSWPKDPDTFPSVIIEKVENAYCEIIKALQQNEKVNLLVNDKNWEDKVRNKLETKNISAKNVLFHHIKTVDVWTRDYGPIFIVNKNIDKKNEAMKKIAITKWIFNAWGKKYEDLMYDNIAGEHIAKTIGLEVFSPEIILEGGSIDVNGKGTLLTTEQCLLNKNRNPHLTKSQIEQYLKDYLGIDNVIWLKDGVAGDDTDGHIDDIARFVNENTIVCAVEDDPKDENYKPLKENFEILKKTGFNVIQLPMPKEISVPERRLPASYANFYIGNKVVLLPAFNDKNDKKAIEILQKCFPDRKIIPIQSKELVYGFGGIHCMTQQQPTIL